MDSGDDNESERHSNQSSNRTTNQNSQRRLHGPTINSRNNFHNHGQQPSLPSTSAQSPLSHQHQSLQQRAILTAAASAAAAAASVPNYMNISSNSGGGGGGAIGKAINNLDLICGVVDAAIATSSNSSGSNSNVNVSLNNSLGGAVGGLSAANPTNSSNVLNRQMRLRVYGNGKGGMVRHETKL